LEEDDEEEKDEEIGAPGIEEVPEAVTEATPLLRSSRSLSRSRRRRGSVSVQGTASVTQAVLMVGHISSTLPK